MALATHKRNDAAGGEKTQAARTRTGSVVFGFLGQVPLDVRGTDGYGPALFFGVGV